MEATTMEQWEDNEEMDMGLRARLPRTNDKTNMTTNSGGDDAVYSSQSSSTEAEFHGTEEEEEVEEEQKGEVGQRNGFDMVSDTNGGTESNGSNGGHADFYTFEKKIGNEIVASGTQTNPHQDVDDTRLKDDEFPFGSLPTKQSIEENGHHASLQNGKDGPAKVESSYISEQQASELYLERVYEKPAAHEFYCPHCNTCITKVLIREREPESRPEAVPLPEPIDTIRCTSCFSFLIPAGIWFFPKSAAKEEAKTEQAINIEDTVGASLPSHDYSNGTIGYPNSQVVSLGKGSVPIESAVVSKPLNDRIGVELPVPPQGSNGALYDETVEMGLPIESVGISKPLYRRIGMEQPVPLQGSNGALYDKTLPMTGQSVGVTQATSVDRAPEANLDSNYGLPVPSQESNGISYDNNRPILAQEVEVTDTALVTKTLVPGDFVEQAVEVTDTALVTKAPVPGDFVEQAVEVTDTALIAKASVPGDFVEASINGVQVPVPSYDSNGTLHNQKSPSPGQSVVSITVTTQSAPSEVEDADAGPTESKPRDSTTVIIRSDGPPIISETSDAKTFEVLKSIVYGGLAEAIASLSIVTSAASAGTTTLNILALALANLLGGLFIIGHNLWELKDDKSRITSTQTGEQVDKYEEVLGKKDNFFLHASVAILSFLIFGLAPPLVYAFSFRQSNETDLKLGAVAASSLICIILLAVGKAYNQRPQKYIKTVVYYTIIGVGVAGVSYLAGDLIDKLFEKLGWFDSTVAGTLPLPRLSIVEPGWKSW